MAYVLRSKENVEKLEKDQISATAVGALPGDVVVDRALKSVYLISADGSRRRCDDAAAKKAAIDRVVELLAALRAREIEQERQRVALRG